MGIATPPNKRRNYAIYRQWLKGIPVSKLARKYDLTTQRIYVILEWVKKRESGLKLPVDNTIAE